jgi:hypothetical protein
MLACEILTAAGSGHWVVDAWDLVRDNINETARTGGLGP